MGYFTNLYDSIYDEMSKTLIDNTEAYLEAARDEGFAEYKIKIEEEAQHCTWNDKENMRIDCQLELEDLSDEIYDAWASVIHRASISAIVFSYIKYILFIPSIVLLITNQVLASQIAILIAFVLILVLRIDTVYGHIVFYLAGISKGYEELEYLYSYYGAAEATLKTVDARGLSRLNRNQQIYSRHHRETSV